MSALKEGAWVILDEMNLASQSVLEGLNAVLDHRATVFIPELNREFKCPPSFRIFACQNPTQQGGGRKGLPKSFLNRFTKVYVNSFEDRDLMFIASALYPQIPRDILQRMIEFNHALFKDTMVDRKYGIDGSPWEFNLRDMLRWCQLLNSDSGNASQVEPEKYLDLMYLQRMRTQSDKKQVRALFEQIFGPTDAPGSNPEIRPYYSITPKSIQIGRSTYPRRVGCSNPKKEDLFLLQNFLNPLESLVKCLSLSWPVIAIGPTAVGKTSLIRLLAQLTGNKLSTFHMNSSVDSTEILGNFEQFDYNRHKKDLVVRIETLIFKELEKHLFTNLKISAKSRKDVNNFVSVVHHVYNLWAIFSKKEDEEAKLTSKRNAEEEKLRTTFFSDEQYKLLLDILEKFEVLYPDGDAAASQEVITEVHELHKKLVDLQKLNRSQISGHFEWIDSILISAMKSGDWILVDNVNLCSSSVLDRLNPLLEPNGCLLLNERGMVDGQTPKVRYKSIFRN